jgi:hypothetical protein
MNPNPTTSISASSGSFLNPAEMTPAQRRAEIVSILARGYLRFRANHSAVNREEVLDAVEDKSVYAPEKGRQ